ncbi:MAG TPA: hypothetical protein VJ521_01845, partial [Acidobacteriota bacterium]|nr:hypothetical protein [Acidobacteriota bacterium]
DEIRCTARQTTLTYVRIDEVDFFGETFRSAARFAALNNRLCSIDASHLRNVTKANQAAHSRAVATTKVDAFEATSDLRAFGEIHRRFETADVDLVSHDEFPKIALGAAIHILNIAKFDFGFARHEILPFFLSATLLNVSLWLDCASLKNA